jgi:hypothetical protein
VRPLGGREARHLGSVQNVPRPANAPSRPVIEPAVRQNEGRQEQPKREDDDENGEEYAFQDVQKALR